MKRALVVLLSLLISASGCLGQKRVIEKLTYQISDNLEVIRVSILFDRGVQSNLGSGFTLKDYGYLFVNPYTETAPFELGFDLNTSIVNDQDYVKLSPATVFPNGVPLGVPHPLVEVRAPQPIHPRFDIYGYVDVTQTNWLGVGIILNEIDEGYFPPGLSVHQILMRDQATNPLVLAGAAGPVLDSNGQRRYPGVISLLANVRELITRAKAQGGKGEVIPEEPIWFSTPEGAQ